MTKPLVLFIIYFVKFIYNTNFIIISLNQFRYDYRLLRLLNHSIYYEKVRCCNHFNSSKINLARMILFCSMHFFSLTTYTADSQLKSKIVFIKFVSYFSIIHMTYFFELHYLSISLTVNVLEQKIQQVELIKGWYLVAFLTVKFFILFLGNLSKNIANDVIQSIRTMASNLIEFNSIFALPKLSSLIVVVMMQISTIAYLFQDSVELILKIFGLILQAYIFFLFYFEANLAELLIKKFDSIHLLLVDKSIETVANFYSKFQKHSRAVSLEDMVWIFELGIYRHYFKIYTFKNVLPLNLSQFGHVCVFILNYTLLLVQTTIF